MLRALGYIFLFLFVSAAIMIGAVVYLFTAEPTTRNVEFLMTNFCRLAPFASQEGAKNVTVDCGCVGSTFVKKFGPERTAKLLQTIRERIRRQMGGEDDMNAEDVRNIQAGAAEASEVALQACAKQ